MITIPLWFFYLLCGLSAAMVGILAAVVVVIALLLDIERFFPRWWRDR